MKSFRLAALVALAGCQLTPVSMMVYNVCEPDDTEFLPPGDWDDLPVAEYVRPFDVDGEDLYGPAYTTYGKTPEIVAISDYLGIDVLAQNYGTGSKAVLMRLEFQAGRYQLAAAHEVPALDRIMGLGRDDDGFLYVASGVSEDADLTPDYPARGEYRSGIVQVVKVDHDGNVVWNTDLDTAREATGLAPELVVNPMVAASARLAVGNGTVALLHGINTDPDPSIGNRRHQKALTTHLDAATGDVTRTASIWVSHSFDQRMIFDGEGFIELHLGDAYPRDIVMARVAPDSGPYPVLHVKGNTGDNNTFSRIGAVALIPEDVDPDNGYLVLFSTESTPDLGASINGPRNLGMVRVRRNFELYDAANSRHLDPALPDTFTAPVDGVDKSNKLQWLTDYDAASNLHAERPQLVSIGCDRYVVLWEAFDGPSGISNGTFGMVIDAAGEVLVPEAHVTDHHLPRGDDLFELDNTAAWVSGTRGELRVNRVYDDLSFERLVIDGPVMDDSGSGL